MSEANQAALIISIYRIATIFVGCAIVYFGYRLFILGIFEKAGELKAAWGERNLTLKQASPGTFFVLFGASIIALSIWRGVNVEQYRTPPPTSLQNSELGSRSQTANTNTAGRARANENENRAELAENTNLTTPANRARDRGSLGLLRINGMGGSGAATALLSIQLRRVLSDHATCLIRAIDDTARQTCRDDLSRKLKVIPTDEDLKAIETLEAKYVRTPNSQTREDLLNMKLRFLR